MWPQDSLCVLGIATLCPANSGYCHPPGVPCGWDPPGPGCFLCHRSCAELPHMQPLPAMRTELPTDCPMTGREPVISLVTFLSDSCSPLMGQLLLLSCPPHPAAPGHIPGPDCTGVHVGPGSLTLCSATSAAHTCHLHQAGVAALTGHATLSSCLCTAATANKGQTHQPGTCVGLSTHVSPSTHPCSPTAHPGAHLQLAPLQSTGTRSPAAGKDPREPSGHSPNQAVPTGHGGDSLLSP